MRRILSVDKQENYTICLLEHRLLEICKHYLISFSLDRFSMEYSDEVLKMEKINKDNLHLLKNIGYNYYTMEDYIHNQADLTEGFIYYTKDTNEPVGCIWVMYKGGNEAQYRIRNIDAFGFYFAVFPRFRGNRYVEYFIYTMLKYLKEKGIDTLYASVRKNNTSALKAYERAGVKIEAEKTFCRLIRWRIPYPII